MANKNEGTNTLKLSQNGRQQLPHLFNHHLGCEEHDQFDPVLYQGAATYQNGPPYPDADQFFRDASHRSDAGAGHQDAVSHDHDRKVAHRTEQEHLNAKPYEEDEEVDRICYHTVSDFCDNDLGRRLSEGHVAVTSQARSLLQKFQDEPIKDQPWNGINDFQPIDTANTGEGHKRQQYPLIDSSVKAENGSSTSFGKPYQG